MGQTSSIPTESLLSESEAHRTRARRSRDQANAQYTASVKAWDAGNRSSAANHKEQRQRLQREAAALDKKAADMAFRYFNARYDDKKLEWGTIDLHGLYVDEALVRAKAHLVEGKKRARKMGVERGRMRIITGRGNRSKNGVAVIKPKIQEWCRIQGMRVEQPKNEGLLIVHFDVSRDVEKRRWRSLWLWLLLGGGLLYWLGSKKVLAVTLEAIIVPIRSWLVHRLGKLNSRS